MLYAFEKYNKCDAGYWLRKYKQTGGNIERVHTLIDLSGSDFTDSTYYNDDWFKELYKDSKVKDFCGNTAGSVAQIHTANSQFDNTFINRHAHKEFQPDIENALQAMSEAGAPENVINSFLRNYLKSVFDEYNESFRRIWRVINEQYDPLFNVDVEDIEKHTGSDTDTHTGTDTTAHTGSDTTGKTGYDELKHTGSDTITKTGTDTTAHTGTETLTNDGTDTKTTSGNYEDEKSGSETTKDGNNSSTTTDNSIFVFDSVGAVDDSSSTTHLNTEKTTSFTNRKDKRTYNDVSDETAYDSTHETAYDTSEEITYDSSNETTYNSTNKTTYNNTVETEYDTSNETTYDSENKSTYNSTITRTKKGNQGVTMSQDMLEREIASWSKIDFLKYVVDIVAQDMLLW